MAIDYEDDFLDDPDDIEVDPFARRGVLAVPGIAANSAVIEVLKRWYETEGVGAVVIFTEFDDLGREVVINLEEFNAYGYRGTNDASSVQQWISEFPRDEARDGQRDAEILAARGSD